MLSNNPHRLIEIKIIIAQEHMFCQADALTVCVSIGVGFGVERHIVLASEFLASYLKIRKNAGITRISAFLNLVAGGRFELPTFGL